MIRVIKYYGDAINCNCRKSSNIFIFKQDVQRLNPGYSIYKNPCFFFVCFFLTLVKHISFWKYERSSARFFFFFYVLSEIWNYSSTQLWKTLTYFINLKTCIKELFIQKYILLDNRFEKLYKGINTSFHFKMTWYS